MFVDIHAHLDRKGIVERLDEVIKCAEEEGVKKIMTAGADLESSLCAVEIAKKYPNVFATVGVHPQDADGYNNDVEKKLFDLCANGNAVKNKIVAYGEFGLDYHYEDSPSKEVQKEVFVKQLILANKLKLPIVLHMRDATEDMMTVLRENKNLINNGGVMHCFAGTVETAKEVLKLGLMISVGGVLTFKKNNLEEVMLAVSLDNIVLETDCPWLAPDPFRGKLNEPKYIPFVAKKLVEIFKCTLKEVEDKTTANAERLFGLGGEHVV